MIGVAVVAFFAVFAHAITGDNDAALRQHVRAAFVVAPTADGAKIDGAIAPEIARVPGVASSTAVSREVSRIDGGQVHAAFGVDPRTLLTGYRFRWKDGSNALVRSLGAHEALMADGIAKDEHLHVGQTFAVTTPAGTRARFRLVGTFQDERYLAGYVIGQATWRTLFASNASSMVLAGLAPGSDAQATEDAIRVQLERHRGVRVQSHAEIEAVNQSDSNQIVALVDMMLALSLIISLFGIVNTLVLSVLERTH
jgi:putative ABC transport system permease protein